jgi:predicted metal-dependent hydrolase
MKTWRDKEQFKARVLEWADKLGVKTRAVALRPMSNKWASCSTAGNLNFNAELIELDRDILRPEPRQAVEEPHAGASGGL